VRGPAHDELNCPGCDGFGWLDGEQQPTGPQTSPRAGDRPCDFCNGACVLNRLELLELRTLARDAAIILGGDCAVHGSPGSRWPNHARLSKLVGPDPRRTTATAVELERWHAD
jgi:hypothetical protein